MSPDPRLLRSEQVQDLITQTEACRAIGQADRSRQAIAARLRMLEQIGLLRVYRAGGALVFYRREDIERIGALLAEDRYSRQKCTGAAWRRALCPRGAKEAPWPA